MSRRALPWALPVAVAAVWACSSGSSENAEQETSPSTPAAPSDPKGGDRVDAGGTTDGGDGSAPASNETDPNFKVAFVGDTSTGGDFKNVLKLIHAENAQAVVVQGDLTYLFDSVSGWLKAADNEIDKAWPGSTATVTIPYFVARGNHDLDWNNFASQLTTRMNTWHVTPTNNTPAVGNYSLVYKGLSIVMANADETASPTRADYVKERLAADAHTWKICSWHKNQRATNVGPKDDEMGWQIYENCRAAGAIVAQGHSHTYSRSKTMTNDTAQVVDPSCSDPYSVCVGPGRHFFFDSSLGGVETRSLDSVSSRPYWAATYSGNFGALFITFNVDGDPHKATGYFKTVGGTVIDPPPSSGKNVFTITRSF